ncbi:MAG: DUF2269 family protein [Gemmatimonadota bacterium]
MDTSDVFLLLHVVGFVLWMGIAFILPFVTGRAARSGSLEIAAFAYRTWSDLLKTVGLTGMVLTLAGGFGLTAARQHPLFQPFPDHWLFQMQLLGVLAFLVSVFYLIPLSDKLARAAEASATAGEKSVAFQKYRKRNALVGSLTGLVLLLIVILATLKP